MEKLLIFIPAYNCEKQVPRVLSQLLDPHVLPWVGECIVVNNRSTDGTEAAYDALYRALMADLQSRYPAAQVESILMHEVIHWLRLMPYKLAKDRKRAPMFYAGLVMVANDVANFAKGENVC